VTPPPVIDPGANDPSASVIQRVVDVLDDMGIEYVFTGALALAYWVAPRGTKDIDIVVMLPETEETRRELLRRLEAAGFPAPPGALEDLKHAPNYSTGLRAVLPTGAVFVVELLVPKPGQEKLTSRIAKRAKLMPFIGVKKAIPIVSPEDLVVYKLFLFRKGERPLETDDVKDMNNILAVRKDLDAGYVRLSLLHLGLPQEALAERSKWLEAALVRHGFNKKSPKRPRS